jgi:hypothetical protein
MLTAEQIESNWKEFLGYIDCYITSPRKEKLLKFYNKYSERIVLMPASHKAQYHNCFPGGYVDHVNRVVKAAIKLHQVWFDMGVTMNYTMEELVFAALNHDLGKMGTEEEAAYIEQTDQWRRDKLNETYMYNDKIEFMSVPDRSLFLLQTNGIEVTKNELLAIKLHDGIYDEANKPYLINWLPEQKPRTSLVYIIHHADMLATRIEFEKEWFPKFDGVKKEERNIPTKKTPTPIREKALNNVKSEGLKNVMDDFFK